MSSNDSLMSQTRSEIRTYFRWVDFTVFLFAKDLINRRFQSLVQVAQADNLHKLVGALHTSVAIEL